MKVKCISVRLSSLTPVSNKAFKAVAFDGSSAIIPSSQLYGEDYEVVKSEAYWISEWILKQKVLQYSDKKVAWFDSITLKQLPSYTVTRHIPEKIKTVVEKIKELER